MPRTPRRRSFLALLAATGAGCLRLTGDDAGRTPTVAATPDTPTEATASETASGSPTPAGTPTETEAPTETPRPGVDSSDAIAHRWRYKHRGGQLYLDGTDLFLTGDRVEKLSLTEGYGVWYALDGGTAGSLAASDAALYVADRSAKGSCYKIDRAKGTVEWRKEVGMTIGSGPRLTNSKAIFTARDAETSGVYALDRETGDRAWKLEADEGSYGELSRVNSGQIYAASTGTPEIHRIDAETGETSTTIEESSIERIRVTDDAVYLTTGYDLTKWSRDLSTRRWQFVFETSPRRPPTVEGGAAFVGEKNGSFYRLDDETGEVVWSYPHGFDNVGGFAVGSDTVWMADRGTLHAIDKSSGDGRALGRLPDTGGAASVDGIAVRDGVLVVLTNAVNAYDVTR